jgi:SAM-dependent methyltransferase/uncharacterized protein YbaR (Trm112 family)
MYKEHIKYLRCIKCYSELEYSNITMDDDHIVDGKIVCKECNSSFDIKDGIPRFVEASNYANSFGMQWNIHNSTQYDSYSNVSDSKDRFENETKWGYDLNGEVIIEAGSGSGRFTQFAVKTNAMVLSFDFSNAVEANYKHNKDNKNLLIVQASIYEMPFKDEVANKLFCFGVLQHTPFPKEAFKCLSQKLKKGGRIAADNYPFLSTTWFNTKYWVRPITRNLNHKVLYWWCKQHVRIMWPIFKLNRKIFSHKRANRLNWRLLVPDYTSKGLSEEKLKEWAVLDLFDMLSPKYDKPVKLKTFESWFEEYGFKDIDVHYGYNGCEGRGTKT